MVAQTTVGLTFPVDEFHYSVLQGPPLFQRETVVAVVLDELFDAFSLTLATLPGLPGTVSGPFLVVDRRSHCLLAGAQSDDRRSSCAVKWYRLGATRQGVAQPFARRKVGDGTVPLVAIAKTNFLFLDSNASLALRWQARRDRSDAVGDHHFVVFVLDDVAMPDIESVQVERGPDRGFFTRIRNHRILEAPFP